VKAVLGEKATRGFCGGQIRSTFFPFKAI